MDTFLTLTVGFISGALLGWIYFQGLWWTVQRMVKASNPYRLLIVSFAVRTILIVGGLYVLLIYHWQALAAALAGFMMERVILTGKKGLNREVNTLEGGDGV